LDLDRTRESNNIARTAISNATTELQFIFTEREEATKIFAGISTSIERIRYYNSLAQKEFGRIKKIYSILGTAEKCPSYVHYN
jgi:hypothetical protein